MTQLTRHICALAALPEASAEADWIELIPTGQFRTADKRGAMRLDNADQVIVASFAAAPGGELPIDFDHRSFAGQGSADSRAAGWIKEMKVVDARVMASVVWTPDGKRALQERSYRFVSPVFKTAKDGRVVLIEGAGLVNNPALPQLRQLASKDDAMNPLDKIAGLLGTTADQPDQLVARVTALIATETQLASITAEAGVTGDDAVRQICAKLKEKAPDPSKFVPLASFTELQTQFASLQGDVNKGKTDAALEKARDEGKLTPDMEAWATQLASKDISQFEAWAAVAPVRVNLAGRQLAGRQPPAKTDALDETERQVASLMGVSEKDFLATRNLAVKEG